MSTGVLIVDDSHFMRNLLRQIVEQDHRIVGEATNGAEAVKLYKEHDPDVVMMDIVMPKCNGIKATAAIKKIDPDARVIMCTSVGQREKMKLAVKAGADGYVTKPFEEPSVRKALTDVAAV
ncbi:chemotaxis protein CheY [Natrarchaeobaculum sulfurireducens]|uniref:Chemotaxis regulator-transmits chemoreceptorsignals to flagelllar motor components CheY n=1 Tax=Natrarchaeobaculum sulfurireducens TaxID=2044521 RepID=A0A346PGC0_9EURY|nr:chemotaxis protein CheY [Natrarchaeobaculum sulfurireducens]AXR78565.1 Rec domain [Natrarchaeobaculum sulfurireducens]AXR81384.1 Chemotaxis regulator - transmits chemoreceptorsignals to flagelllar motor components CheY [Natrarchaeobaculum sulfurireducens]